MKAEISVPEIVTLFKVIQQQPDRIYEMIRTEVRENVGQYLSRLMDTELTRFLGPKRYEDETREDLTMISLIGVVAYQ